MEALTAAAWAYMPLTLGVMLLMALAPFAAASARGAFGTVLLLGAAGLVALAIGLVGETAQLDVVNPFLRGADRDPYLYVTESVDMVAWVWPLVAAVLVGLPGLWLLARKTARGGVPHPVALGVGLGLWVLASRLALEKTAAPIGLVWSLGLTTTLVVLSPAASWAAGRRGYGIGKLIMSHLGIALVLRLAVSGFSYLATTRGWGTHLDLNVLEDINPPGFGPFTFADDPVAKWLNGALIPQLVLWVPASVIGGVVLGFLPWWTARRRR